VDLLRNLQLLIVLALLPLGETAACLRPYTPAVYEPSDFSAIFLGEITGVYLTAYESHRLDELHPEDIEASDDPFANFFPTSSTASFDVNAIVLETYRGFPGKSGTYLLGGCRVRVPELKSMALFFVTHDGDTVTVPQESEDFDHWLDVAKALSAEG